MRKCVDQAPEVQKGPKSLLFCGDRLPRRRPPRARQRARGRHVRARRSVPSRTSPSACPVLGKGAKMHDRAPEVQRGPEKANSFFVATVCPDAARHVHACAHAAGTYVPIAPFPRGLLAWLAPYLSGVLKCNVHAPEVPKGSNSLLFFVTTVRPTVAPTPPLACPLARHY